MFKSKMKVRMILTSKKIVGFLLNLRTIKIFQIAKMFHTIINNIKKNKINNPILSFQMKLSFNKKLKTE